MSLKQTIFISLTIVSFIIGVHRVLIDMQTVSVSEAIGYNYWIFMISIAFITIFRYNRKKQNS
ncbi:hypothetical protein I5M27_11125 [Adhaeribacter sp. BT258]|uniref:Uncharacterized protein n=1 Tax=Adhaeribacter terrigena TaxID=2793070 RepID=A0ABS1C2B6_9BACT|nr:hypothetical protein [Adhaeribacter terrigena]MBK0403540.1 hypothetical protein [Adhaeribacter terrigena]